MNNIERGLSEKVMFAIYIDRKGEVENYYRNYIKYLKLLGDRKDNGLLSKINLEYSKYQMKKAREFMGD